MDKNKTMPRGSRCVVNPRLCPQYAGVQGTVLFSQIQPDQPNAIGYHDVRLDNGFELYNLYGDEINPLEVKQLEIA